MKSKFFKILALAAIPLMLSGCGNSYDQDKSMANKYDYSNNQLLANTDEHMNAMCCSISPLDNGKHYGKFEKIYGFCSVLEANVGQDTETVLHIKFNANSGKGKLVLVKPNSEVEVLAEVISEKDKEHFEGDVSAKCVQGVNKIKIVGENYGGSFEIYQPNGVIFNNINEVEVKY